MKTSELLLLDENSDKTIEQIIYQDKNEFIVYKNNPYRTQKVYYRNNTIKKVITKEKKNSLITKTIIEFISLHRILKTIFFTSGQISSETIEFSNI